MIRELVFVAIKYISAIHLYDRLPVCMNTHIYLTYLILPDFLKAGISMIVYLDRQPDRKPEN